MLRQTRPRALHERVVALRSSSAWFAQSLRRDVLSMLSCSRLAAHARWGRIPMTTSRSQSTAVFLACDRAIQAGVLIRRASRQDKEFHFQNWFSARLDELGLRYDTPARNSYPDFRLVLPPPEGFEIKGLAYPGREANYDSNSQAPSGRHNGRTIYYLFGRYPKDPDTDEYPVIDLVMCHGDFLNAEHNYVHANKNIKGFGSYGDVMIRDRKMYVAPTPFALTEGTTAQRTLILPKDTAIDRSLTAVGELVRVEAARLVIGYAFDLRTNELKPEYVDNPDAGKEHRFIAYRPEGFNTPTVTLKRTPIPLEVPDED